ncbi:hypothetical protein Bca52824_032386 [Brassica carinata]|uniref:Uncharacterized protein n=1 Tax=Brassica carinata TaxID=52824 RepID=A0A8X7V539_BRACI|nr:hypothetical protein Bca52824_032386 [Brassica carinata]
MIPNMMLELPLIHSVDHDLSMRTISKDDQGIPREINQGAGTTGLLSKEIAGITKEGMVTPDLSRDPKTIVKTTPARLTIALLSVHEDED